MSVILTTRLSWELKTEPIVPWARITSLDYTARLQCRITGNLGIFPQTESSDALHCTACSTWHYISLHFFTSLYITLQHITINHITLHCHSLPLSNTGPLAKRRQSICGLAVMTSASHAEGRHFDPGQVYVDVVFPAVCCCLRTSSADYATSTNTQLICTTCIRRNGCSITRKKVTRCMQRVRIELTTLGLWDLRAANCAIAASTLMRGGDLLITNRVRTHTLNNEALMSLNARGTRVQLAVWSSGMIHASGARGSGVNSRHNPVHNCCAR